LHVPLIIRYPQGRFAGKRVKNRVNLIDIFPTILATAEINPGLSYTLPGVDISAFANEPDKIMPRCLFSETWLRSGFRPNMIAILDEDGYKRAIMMIDPQKKEIIPEISGLWHLDNDPGEERNLIDELPVRAAYDEQLLGHWMATQSQYKVMGSGESSSGEEIPENLREDLEAMGYL